MSEISNLQTLLNDTLAALNRANEKIRDKSKRIAELEANLTYALEALEPFAMAKLDDEEIYKDNDYFDQQSLLTMLMVGNLRNARAVYYKLSTLNHTN